jgi:hypothetical protein
MRHAPWNGRIQVIDDVSNAIELDVLAGVNRALEPLGHIAEAVPRIAICVSEYRCGAIPGVRE